MEKKWPDISRHQLRLQAAEAQHGLRASPDALFVFLSASPGQAQTRRILYDTTVSQEDTLVRHMDTIQTKYVWLHAIA